MAEYEDSNEDFDPQWENPTIEDIDNVPDMKQYEMGFDEDGEPTVSCEYDEAGAALHEDHKAFVHDFNETGAELIELTGQGIEGIDTTEVADIINDNDALLEAETNFGEGCGQAMQDLSGTISDADLFMAESDYLASQSEDIPDSNEISDHAQLEGQMGFVDNSDE